MTDERPRPQFGEYATREEQLARIKAPSPEQLDHDHAPATPAPEQRQSASLTDAKLLASNRTQFNVVGTIAFLVYGLIEVVITAPTFLDMSVLINAQLAAFAESLNATIDPYPITQAATLAGYGLIAVWVLLWLGAALWSWRRLRGQKFTLWIPFFAGVLANLIAGVVITVLLFNDPTVSAQLMDAFAKSMK
ncbi:MAG: DUF6264 family protein [Agromyces sp.]